MRRRIAASAVLVLAAAAGGCAGDDPAMPAVCTEASVAAYAHALQAAPGPVRLTGDVPISVCARRASSTGQLRDLGTVLSAVAHEQAEAAREHGDVQAGLRLGYLAGAVHAGASRSGGVVAELDYRITNAARGIDRPQVAQALERGIAAGRATG
jgi:hypothetical protein